MPRTETGVVGAFSVGGCCRLGRWGESRLAAVPVFVLTLSAVAVVLLTCSPFAQAQPEGIGVQVVEATRASTEVAAAALPAPAELSETLKKGIALVEARKYEQAARHFADAIDRDKNSDESQYLLHYAGICNARLGKPEKAIVYLKRLIKDHPKAPFADAALYERAWCEKALQRNEQATKCYELLLKSFPTSPLAISVQAELAELKITAGMLDEGIAALAKAMAATDDSDLRFHLQFQLASAYYKKKDYERSAEHFEKMIPDARTSALLPSILVQAGESRRHLDESTKARKHYLAASKLRGVPESLAETILLRLAESQIRTEQYEEGEASYRQFLEQYKRSRWARNAHYGLARALERQRKYKPAISHYTQAAARGGKNKLPLDKWTAASRFQIGECFFALRDYDKAVEVFEELDATAKAHPSWQAKAVLEIGRIKLAQKKNAESKARLDEVIKRFPKTREAALARRYLDKIQ